MTRNLFLCNTVYQVFVAMWIRHSCIPDGRADILISDHMNNGRNICENIRKCGTFDECFFVETLSYARGRSSISKNQIRQIRFFPNGYLKRFCNLIHPYDNVFMANVDKFSQLLYNAVSHRSRRCKLYLYEDGLATYSKLMKGYYESTKLPELDGIHSALRKLFREKGIYGNVEGLYLFNPPNMLWDAPFPLRWIDKIRCDDKDFVSMCNHVFNYSDSVDKYDKKYIFMEESFAAEGTPINDVEILESLANRVGKENIIVKIHPRNPINRFAEAGFLTNKNTSIPWEVILLNLKDVSDKVFVTVGSSSVLNPIILFGAKIRAYSLYNLIDKESCRSALLSGDFWEAVYSVIQKYPDMIKICDSVEEIN